MPRAVSAKLKPSYKGQNYEQGDRTFQHFCELCDRFQFSLLDSVAQFWVTGFGKSLVPSRSPVLDSRLDTRRLAVLEIPHHTPGPARDFGCRYSRCFIRFGGDAMSLLKVCALTTSGLILWLAPPFTLSRKIPLHNWVTGLSLMGGFACCFESRRIALKLAQAEEFESMREAVVVADAVDELATSAYVSEQQRRMEAESILNTAGSEQVEHLERSLALSHSQDDGWSSERSNQLAENADSELLERILELQAKGYGKAKIILELWGVTKGGSPKYKAAEAEYKRLVGE